MLWQWCLLEKWRASSTVFERTCLVTAVGWNARLFKELFNYLHTLVIMLFKYN